MELTKTQQELKNKIVAQILKEKQEALDNILRMQRLDEGEAQATMDDTENYYEDGKIDQARNRITARSTVADALAREIGILKGIDSIEPTEEIQLGDVVHTNMGKFFVAVASDPVEIEGETYTGISTESPLFQALLGKHNGDAITVNGNTFTLQKSF